jgi:hypothetical protein
LIRQSTAILLRVGAKTVGMNYINISEKGRGEMSIASASLRERRFLDVKEEEPDRL